MGTIAASAVAIARKKMFVGPGGGVEGGAAENRTENSASVGLFLPSLNLPQLAVSPVAQSLHRTRAYPRFTL